MAYAIGLSSLGFRAHDRVPALVCINKYDINVRKSDEISDYCTARRIQVVGRVPFDTVVTEAMVQGKAVTAYGDGAVSQVLREVWRLLRDRLAGN